LATKAIYIVTNICQNHYTSLHFDHRVCGDCAEQDGVEVPAGDCGGKAEEAEEDVEMDPCGVYVACEAMCAVCGGLAYRHTRGEKACGWSALAASTTHHGHMMNKSQSPCGTRDALVGDIGLRS